MESISKTKRVIISLLKEKERDWRELKEILGLSDSVLAKHIKDLEKMRILQTKIDPSDRRKKIYSLNPIIKLTSDRLAIILLTYFASQSVSDFEKLKENLAETALICMAGEERGLDILKGILSILKEVIQENHPEKWVEYRKKFEEIFEATKKTIYKKSGTITADVDFAGDLILQLAVMSALETILKTRKQQINDVLKKV